MAHFQPVFVAKSSDFVGVTPWANIGITVLAALIVLGTLGSCGCKKMRMKK